MENKKNPIKIREIFGLLSFFFGLMAIFFEIAFLINLTTNYSLTSVNYLGDIFLFFFRVLFQHGGYFLIVIPGFLFGLSGLRSSKRKLAKQGIILSLVGFLFYLVLTIALFSNSLG
ncbi:MAG: hypothetical protein NTX14_03890 [Candidatus Nealsonbacteria bacterium]|nr:hypothetical protein [Candidatus Nealsonbacteria bacterium]